MKRTDIFAYPIWQWESLGLDNSKLANHAYTLKDKHPDHRNPEDYSKYSLKWKSYNLTKKDFLAYPETKKLMDMIISLVEPCFKELNPRSSVRLVVDSVWFNIYPPDTQLEIHPHPGNVLSGTYYIKAKPKCGDLVYFTPDVSTYYIFSPKYFSDRNNITAVKHYISPVEGSMVLAPSNIQHAVKENKSDDDRISFSFNLGVMDTNTNTPNDRYF